MFEKLRLFTLLLILSPQLLASYYVVGTKGPNPNEILEKNLKSSSTKALVAEEDDYIGGFNYFLPYIVPSPDQENAGSCLFMSHTAATEVLMGKTQGRTLDLSERYLMNLSKAGIGEDLVGNWITDTIYRLNSTGETYLNKDFPYLKAFYRYEDGMRVFANENDQAAYYGVSANWVVSLDQLDHSMAIPTPKFKREILFEDPKGNRWNVATAPGDIVIKVKRALDSKKGPVIVIYNHTGFWHAVMVAGYNDHVDNKGCSFTANYSTSMNQRADQIDLEADSARNSGDSVEESRLRKKARLFRKRGNQVEKSFQNSGGCSGKGAFYVRDSIYPLNGNPLYDYDPSRTGEEKPLNAKVILREYEWLRHLSNHVIHIKD